MEELEVPRKMLASSMAPHSAPIPSGEVLHASKEHANFRVCKIVKTPGGGRGGGKEGTMPNRRRIFSSFCSCMPAMVIVLRAGDLSDF